MNQTDRNGSGATPRRTYDETYKRHAVELTMQRERTVKEVARFNGATKPVAEGARLAGYRHNEIAVREQM